MLKTIFSKDHKTLIGKLKTAREDSGLDQAQVAKLLGKSQSHISKVEAGQRRIDVISLKEFARVYRKSIDYFLK